MRDLEEVMRDLEEVVAKWYIILLQRKEKFYWICLTMSPDDINCKYCTGVIRENLMHTAERQKEGFYHIICYEITKEEK